MTRGNQRENARAKNLAKQGGEVGFHSPWADEIDTNSAIEKEEQCMTRLTC
jgi:hypothetical protein